VVAAKTLCNGLSVVSGFDPERIPSRVIPASDATVAATSWSLASLEEV
jgi:hypothetical protein